MAEIVGYVRVADGEACDFCEAVDGAFVSSADPMPLHNGCGCGAEPITADDPRAAKRQPRQAPRDYRQISDRGHGRWPNGTPKMTPKDTVALHDYVAPQSYRAMQTYYRDSEAFGALTDRELVGHELNPAYVERQREQVAGKAQTLAKAIDDYGKSWEGEEFFRVTALPDAIRAQIERGGAPEFVEPGFLSVGENLADVQKIARTTHGEDADLVTLIVRVKSHRPGIAPTDLGYRTVKEVVFGPGTRLRFIGKTADGYIVELI